MKIAFFLGGLKRGGAESLIYDICRKKDEVPFDFCCLYMNCLHLPLINFACLFFLFFLSFPLNIFVNFVFIVLFPTWHLSLVSFFFFFKFCS